MRIVCTCIIDHNGFPLSVILGEQAAQTLWQVFRAVIARNDDAEKRIMTGHLLFLSSDSGEKRFDLR